VTLEAAAGRKIGQDHPRPEFYSGIVGIAAPCSPRAAAVGSALRGLSGWRTLTWRRRAVTDKAELIDGITAVMRSLWDLPADCNAGELFAYAEMLFDRVRAGDGRETLYSFLADVQVKNLEMPTSDVYRDIVDRSIALVRNSTGASPHQ
jgi:hypothetical protein